MKIKRTSDDKSLVKCIECLTKNADYILIIGHTNIYLCEDCTDELAERLDER